MQYNNDKRCLGNPVISHLTHNYAQKYHKSQKWFKKTKMVKLNQNNNK